MQPSSFRRRLLWIVWAVSALACVGLFFIPAFIIRPFRHQSVAALNVALALRQRAPMGTLAGAIVCLGFAIVLWYTSGKWRKGVLALGMVLVVFSAVMARLNYFEWMFHPVPSPQFEAESDCKLDQGEMILAIQFGPVARAYPIREMAYHHIVNDTVAGVPMAVTY